MLYCDTDSLIYKFSDAEPNPIQTDNTLGGLTDELEGDSIEEIVCLAPKTYAYRLKSGGTVVKAKGFRLNCEAMRDINFDSMKFMTQQLSWFKDTSKVCGHNVTYHQIRVNPRSKFLESSDITKRFQLQFGDKREIDFEYSTPDRLTTKALTLNIRTNADRLWERALEKAAEDLDHLKTERVELQAEYAKVHQQRASRDRNRRVSGLAIRLLTNTGSIREIRQKYDIQ